MSDLAPDAWDGLVGAESPFLEHRWLAGLERSGCVGPEQGWLPRPVTVWEGERLVAAAPAYLKSHSMGEFVYDWAWADAAHRAGLEYYPKLVVCVPFTPVTGARLLVADGEDRAERVQQLVGGLDAVARQAGCAGVHVLFTTPAETAELAGLGMMERHQFQFGWENRGYATMADFEAALVRRSRKNLRRERRLVAEHVDIEVQAGDELRHEDLMLMERLYRRTSLSKMGRAYLERALWEELPDWGRVVLFVARREGRMVAGAFCVQKGDTLYGRYWGCTEHVDLLHFELCYHRPVQYCIEHGLARFEPGQGGGHKYTRGFLPFVCRSAHLLYEGRLHQALAHHCQLEREDVADRVRQLREDGPVR